MGQRLLSVFLIFVSLNIKDVISDSDIIFENPLIRAILRNSSKYVRPVRNQNLPTNVTFRLNLYQILGADTVNQNIHLHFWAEMLWFNEFLHWDPREHNQISRLDFEQKYMWIPDIMFFNQLSGLHFNEHFPAPPAIFHTGMILVLKPFRVELQCKLKVLHFPFDRQECNFDVGSWAHSMDEIDIQSSVNDFGEVNAADLRFFKNSSLFTLTQFSVESYYYSDPELNNRTFSGLTYKVRFYREAAYFVINLIMPSLMINVLCMLNFAIPCSSGEKVGYGITVFLAQSVNLMVVMEMMPQGGMSILGIFLAVSILLIGLSLLMNVITLRIYSPSHTKERPWPKLRSICNKLKVLVGPKDPLPDIVLARRHLSFVSNALQHSEVEGQHSDEEEDINEFESPEFILGGEDSSNILQIRMPNGRTQGQRSESFSEVYFSGTDNNGEKETKNDNSNSNNNNKRHSNTEKVTNNGNSDNILNTYEKSPLSYSAQNSVSHFVSPRRRGAVMLGDQNFSSLKKISSNYKESGEVLRELRKRGKFFSPHDLDDDNVEAEKDYTLEWQQHAEIINRFNALIFSLLLLLNGVLYAMFHSPEAQLVGEA